VSVRVQTVVGGTAAATAPSRDYTPVDVVVNFAPNTVDGYVDVPILADTRVEPDETIVVHASSTDVPVSRPDGTITILTDD
jgi:hypothetical protein